MKLHTCPPFTPPPSSPQCTSLLPVSRMQPHRKVLGGCHTSFRFHKLKRRFNFLVPPPPPPPPPQVILGALHSALKHRRKTPNFHFKHVTSFYFRVVVSPSSSSSSPFFHNPFPLLAEDVIDMPNTALSFLSSSSFSLEIFFFFF